MRDQRAAPLYSYLVRQMDRGRFPQLYLTAIEALGSYGGADAIEALKVALHTGHWWTIFANRKYGGAAAHALRRIGTVGAMDALREASASGAPGRAAPRRLRAELPQERGITPCPPIPPRASHSTKNCSGGSPPAPARRSSTPPTTRCSAATSRGCSPPSRHSSSNSRRSPSASSTTSSSSPTRPCRKPAAG